MAEAGLNATRLSRRDLLAGVAAGVSVSTGISGAASPAGASGAVAAIAFDAFPIFDPRPIAAEVEARVPGQGQALAKLWTPRLFAATWLETAAGRYRPFEAIAAATLEAAAASLGVGLAGRDRDAIVAHYGQLSTWPDVKPALARLKAAGLRLAFLSNLAEPTLRANMERAGISDAFEAVLSTDRVRSFKPSPRAYAMATEAFRLPASAIGFAAFGGWDAVGATWFGYRTAWIDRSGAPAEPFDAHPAIVSPGFEGVLQLAGLA